MWCCFDDETKEICKEIVRCGGLDGRVNMALDYFDASINRVSAWTVGFRNVEKALLSALLHAPRGAEELQDTDQFTELLVRAGGAEDPALWRGLGRILPPERRAGGRCMVAEVKKYEQTC